MTSIGSEGIEEIEGMSPTAVAAKWEARLEREGLAPIEREGSDLDWKEQGSLPIEAEAVDAWRTWAVGVLKSYPFVNAWQRSAWTEYAGGKSLSEIALKFSVSRRHVTRTIGYVTACVDPAPVVNPWRKSGRVQPQNPIAAKLQEILKDQETEMAEAKRVTYDLIMLKNGHEVNVPNRRPPGGKTIRQFKNVEGKPHAGGIDVDVGTHDKTGPTITTITLPWDTIAQADRSRADDPSAE